MQLPLRLTGVVKTFGSRRALDGVELELREGEVLGLLGPNGAGKSTLVRTIMGRVAPDSGSVELFGAVAAPRDTAARARVGFVPQEIALYPLLTARENLVVFGRYLGLSKEAIRIAIERSLEWSGLRDRADDSVKDFSGGMKRRLNIGAGVLHDPTIVLLDEPTVGVDPQSRERIYEMIGSMKQKGVSLIYTTHYMEEAERLCDRIAVIDHGRVIALGSKEELVQSVVGTEREVVVQCANDVPPELALELESTGAVVTASEIRATSLKAPEMMLRILKRVEERGVAVSEATMKSPTLETVFLKLTGRDLRE